MIDIKELPRNPVDAIQSALIEALTASRSVNGTIKDLKNQNNHVINSLIVAAAVARRASARIEDPEIRELIVRACNLDDSQTTKAKAIHFETALEGIAAYQLDGHFIDEIDDAIFDQAELSHDEKSEIRRLMARARSLVDVSATLKEWQRKKVLYYISKIENELHKEKSSFQTFIAAAGEVSGLVKKVGEDAQPIADAIEKARTITEKKIEGNFLLEKENTPKQITYKDK